MDRNNRHRMSREHAGRLIEYFEALNSGDQARWQRAFDRTWHPEGIVDGWEVGTLRDRHHQRLVAGQVQRIHIIRYLDASRIEFTTEHGWRRDGPFVATFRDGRVYRVL